MNTKNGGISILILIILCVIIILTFSVSKTNIQSVPEPKDNFGQIEGGVRNLWNDYLEKPINYIWKDVIIKIFWTSFTSNMGNIRDGKPTDFGKMVPISNLNN